MSKSRRIGNKISKGVALNAMLPAISKMAITKKVKRIDLLNKIAFDKSGRYTSEQKMQARVALRKIASYSFATIETQSGRVNHDNWRVKHETK